MRTLAPRRVARLGELIECQFCGGLSQGIYAGSLDGGSPKRFAHADAAAVVSPSGFLLFPRQTTLVAQAFDFKRQELSGNPFPVAEQAAFVVGTLAPGFSATSSIVVMTGWPVAGNRDSRDAVPGSHCRYFACRGVAVMWSSCGALHWLPPLRRIPVWRNCFSNSSKALSERPPPTHLRLFLPHSQKSLDSIWLLV